MTHRGNLRFWVHFLNAAEQSRRHRAAADDWRACGYEALAAELDAIADAWDIRWDQRARAHHDGP